MVPKQYSYVLDYVKLAKYRAISSGYKFENIFDTEDFQRNPSSSIQAF